MRHLARVLMVLAVALAAATAHASETVKDRFVRALAGIDPITAREPVEVILSLWHAHELATQVPDGVALFLAASDKLVASKAAARLPHVRTEATLAHDLMLAETGGDLTSFARAGVPTTGLVLGPLPGPEAESAIAPIATQVAGKHGPTGWRHFTVGATPFIPLGDYMPSSGDAHVRVGFALDVAEPTEARIVLGTNGPFVATLDGLPLASFAGERELTDWQHDLVVSLAKGTHWLEIAVGHRTLAPELRLRMLRGDGTAFATPLFHDVAEPPALTASWTPIAAPRVKGLPALAAKNRSLAARLGVWVEATTPSERAAANRIEALIPTFDPRPLPKLRYDDPPLTATPEVIELYYLLGRAEKTDPSRAIAAFEKADTLAGGHSQALAALIDIAEKNQLGARADTLARRLAKLDPKHPAAIGHQLLRRFELADAASALPLLPGPNDPAHLAYNPRLLALEATLAESAGEIVRAANAWSRLAVAQLGASEPLQRATQLYLRANRQDLALSLLQSTLDYRPMAADVHILRARARALGREPIGAIIADLDELRAFHHQSPLFEEMRGRLLLLAGDRGDAIEAFDRALELAPQNRELADYRSSLVAERGLAERWAEPFDAIVMRAQSTPRRPEGAINLFERTVTEVFPSGLASQFRQLALRIDHRGLAERYEDMVFAFTPGEDRLEILEAEVIRKTPGGIERLRPQQIGEQRVNGKSEGVYTLTAYKVVRFPPLEVGDIVHVQIRKDEIGSRNIFGDFFGVFFPMSGELPKARVEAIVVAPASRKLHFKAAGLPEPQVTTSEGMQQLTFAADHLPAIQVEPSMPGYGDIASWVSVSTFESWQALATWYRQLVLPQIETPPDLVGTARRLVEGLTSLEDRVAAIHRWVVTTTRYVGIEFGIHGFKPYKVAEVVQRGYGDCKDKASLLVAMLRAASVPAEFVLVRTRDLGAIEGTPATLWAFNHAIAYVPGLDLYLDGTAESAGIGELPELDQDAQVLRIDLLSQKPPVLTRIPIQPPASNRGVANARYAIDSAGDATADLVETIAGTSAGRLRARLQDASRRDALLAEIIAGQHPGTELVSASYENLDVLGRPVTIRASIRLPKLAVVTGSSLELPLVLEPGSRLVQMAPLQVRKQPLVLTQTELEESTDVYVLPAGARLAAIPPPVKVTSAFGSWQLEVRLEGGEVIATSRWELVQTRISPAEYPAFRRFLEDVAKSETTRLRIELPASSSRAP